MIRTFLNFCLLFPSSKAVHVTQTAFCFCLCFYLYVIGNVVWLDEVTATRALINMSSFPDQEKAKGRENNEEKTAEKSKKGR